jgi:hypothetical protein
LATLNESRQPIERLALKGDYFNSAVVSDKTQRAFVVEHPITIKWEGPQGDGTMCIRAAMYSPYPVSLNQDYCIK